MRSARRAPRGVTLVELLVGSVVGLFAAALAVMVLLGHQRSLLGKDLRRALAANARDTMLVLETPLRRAGWGIDPRFAFDLRNYACATPPCRDRTDGPDELVFVARNPYYQWVAQGVEACTTAGGCFTGNAWPIEAATATTVRITARAGDLFPVGQVVLAACAGGSSVSMATVAQKASGPGSVTLQLQAAVAGNPYRENALTNGCFSSVGAGLFLVDRFRLAIRQEAGVSWLVLDRGLDLVGDDGRTSADGDLDELVPIAPDVEDLQIAYVFNPGAGTGPDLNRNWIVADDASTTTREEPNPTLTAPTYATASTDASRQNLHPANLSAVRLSLSFASRRRDPSQPATWAGDPFLRAENRSSASVPAVTGGLRRTQLSTTVWLRNLESRSPFLF